MTTLYGIPNCDTVRKARKWLAAHDIDYRFHDFRKDGLSEAKLKSWVEALGWEPLLNKRGQSWRKLPETAKTDLDETRAIRLMLAEPTLIKRPVLEHAGQVRVGFDEPQYAQLLG